MSKTFAFTYTESMKLYLSSLGFPDKQQYQNLFTENKRVALIPTACNDAPDKQEGYIAWRKQELEEMGFTIEVIDISQYENKKDEIAAKIRNFDGVWVLGGNTFYLNYWMHQSGVADLLPELLKGGFVYGGESAGGLIAGTTLHGIELLDDPAEAPEIIWNGMGFVDYGILPHKGNAEYAAQYNDATRKMSEHTHVKMLTDDDFIIAQ